MSETLYFLMIGLVAATMLLFFKPFRDFVLSIFKATSVWGLVWSMLSAIMMAHWTVIRNFMPRSFVMPTLDDRKTTNAEED